MAEDVKNAMGKMSRVLRVAKDRAHAQFDKAKEMAQRFSRGSPSGQQPSPTLSAPGDQKVQRLMALGFSAVAARQGLRACGGDIQAASAWLLDERNADELLAAEVAAAEVSRDLVAGSSARIGGLRSAAELNGRVVQLQKWDEATHRWIVSLRDGSVKSIRAQNLDPLDMPSGFEAAAPRHRQARSEAGGAVVPPVQPQVVQPVQGAAPETAECLDREELKRLAREMLASAGEQASDEVLNELNVEDLLELVNTLQIDSSASPRVEGEDVDVTASAGYPPDHPAAPRGASTSSTSSTRPAEKKEPLRPEVASERSERERLELEEARLQSLAEAQSQRARELEAREEALREAEERLEKRRAEVDAAREEQKEPVPVRIPFVLPEGDMSPATQALEEERAELQRLREEVEAAAKEMEVRQQAAKQRAEERELQFLEEESAQMQMASTLKEEEARLEMQRRSLGMLQQALFKGATASAQNGYMEHSLNDEDAQEHGEQGPGQAASAGKVSLVDDDSEPGDEVWDLDWSAVSAKDGPEKALKASTSSEPAPTGETA